MTTLDVTVTEKNITEGHRSSINSCPLALAINTPVHKFPQNKLASVHLEDGWFSRIEEAGQRATRYKFKLPKIASDFIESWQNGAACEPIQFSLELENLGQAQGCGTV